ncbi:PilN domain-containing protein [Wielerella bovis]|uniref:PilN domain-containing protein n=1 Tax=Wielerella bovis TaxID=2917790 RepID=UPI0020191AFF|nr:PilN domain-containing protein [Wielerella bovis]MCG7656832.1 PilN domain-containing protein [Wielerella bovis]MCG7659055.1 PilN domain-containing protein [Wielerella bovis]ULJ61253.1 PilN domain-containing protein [Wielerella bovis]ULJ63370.1 PilN domain-containing protein [Wielerella bovis]ULJ65540.1 PilN domain-containing protein [Wielerella bovis]
MNLIKINLLPYREIQEQKQKKRFAVIMGIGAAAGLALCGMIYLGLEGMISRQDSRNESLQAGLKVLDKDLAEIKELQKQKQNFLARKLKVEELDHKRFEGARMIDTLNQLVPDGAYVSSIKSNSRGDGAAISTDYTIIGKAISDNKVAMFMTALPSTGVFEAPQLVDIKKTDDGQQFTLKTVLVEQKVASVPESVDPAKDKGGEK